MWIIRTCLRNAQKVAKATGKLVLRIISSTWFFLGSLLLWSSLALAFDGLLARILAQITVLLAVAGLLMKASCRGYAEGHRTGIQVGLAEGQFAAEEALYKKLRQTEGKGESDVRG